MGTFNSCPCDYHFNDYGEAQMTLLEEVAVKMKEGLEGVTQARVSGFVFNTLTASKIIASSLLSFIENHPETIERRRKDFEEGKESGMYYEGEWTFDDYLAAEKKV